MATDTAVAPSSTSTHTDPTRHLWQLPVLLLGIAVFVCVWKGWLPTLPTAKDNFPRDVAALKSAHEKVVPDPTELKQCLSKVAQTVEAAPPDQALQARFHLGSGYVRLAEVTAAPDEARGYWILALQHFDLITENQLRDPADGPRLIFRSAKAHAAGLPQNTPAAEITQLIATLSTPLVGEESGETQRLIAELALRLPDYARAKIALTQYLTSSGVATPSASLSRARLLLGTLYLEPPPADYEKALKWLGEIGADAPADVLAPAKAALARVLMASSNWLEAVKQLELLRGAPGVQPSIRLNATYQLGVCKLKMREPEVAAKFFEEAAKGDGPEARAGALQLANLHLQTKNPARHKAAADLLTNALKTVRQPADYDGQFMQLIPINEAQAIFELAVATLLVDGAYEPAFRVAESYAFIASPEREREKRAEVLAAWATAKKGNEAKPIFKKAADEFAALAAFQPKTEGKIEMLRRSATLSRQADEPNAAVDRLKEALKLPGIPDPVLQTVCLELVDALLAAGKSDEVAPLINKILAESTPLSTATRYRLARVFVDSRHPGLVATGRMLFEQIAKKQNILPEEREYHERSLTELANTHIREGNFTDAELRLRTQLGIYPNGPEAPLARLLLGVCLLQRAAAPNLQVATATELRGEALVCFTKIVDDCDQAERRNGKLTDREAWLRLQAALRVLQTYQQMKMPDELLKFAGPLLDRHKNTVEELIILSLVFHAYKQSNLPNRTQRALETRAQMRETFERLPPSAFPQQDKGEYSREYWQKVWFPPEK
jgi:hypothetical protein